MRIARPAGSILFNLAVFEAVLESVEKFYSRGRAVMSLPGYLNFIADPVVVLGVALLGLWLLHRASSASGDNERPANSLVDPSGHVIPHSVFSPGMVGKRDLLVSGAVVLLAVGVYFVWIFASPRVPDKQAFDEWALDFNRVVRSIGNRPVVAAESAALAGINGTVQPVYVRTIETLRGVLTAYRKKAPNTYIWLPHTPESVFSGEAAAYKGAVTISRDCAWYVHFESPRSGNTRRGPTLLLDLMDGDGSTKGGTGIGSVSFAYDFDKANLAVTVTGAPSGILADEARSAPANEVEFMVSKIAKRLIENQLDTCKLTESGV